MRFTETPIPGAVVLELDRRDDERGFFARVWDPDELRAAGLTPGLAQASISRSSRAGTLRGMHFQRHPHEEAKLVRCVRGTIFDVVLDLRPESPSYLGWHGVRLDHQEARALYVPEGCAHGFQTLEPDTDVLYLISYPYIGRGMVIFRDPHGHRMITTPVKRVLGEPGGKMIYVETENSVYRLEIHGEPLFPMRASGD